MDLHFLGSDRPLSKTISITPDGEYEITPYPLVSHFISYAESVKTPWSLYKALVAHAKQDHCLLKGGLDRPLQGERRAKHTHPDTLTELLVLDLDGANLTEATLDAFLAQLNLEDISYTLQRSASDSLTTSHLRAHVFILLNNPVHPKDIKRTITYYNLTIPTLQDHIALASGARALRYPLDITVNQPDKLIYIAPPTFVHPAEDPLDERISFHRRKHSTANTKRFLLSENKANTLDQLYQDRLNELRATTGLPATQTLVRQDVVYNPEPDQVVAWKDDGDYIRVNLTDSDSWGYYIRKSNPKILYNFKDLPPMYLPVLDPKFYATITGVTPDLVDVEIKDMETTLAKQQQRENKEAEAEARKAEREARRAEKEAEAEARKAEREARRAEKEAEAEARRAEREACRAEKEAEAKARKARQQKQAERLERELQLKIEREQQRKVREEAKIKAAKEKAQAKLERELDDPAYRIQTDIDGNEIFAFIDNASDQFYVGKHVPDTGALTLSKTSSFQKVQFWYLSFGLEAPLGLDRWRYEMQPNNPVRFDFDEHFINKFEPTPYMEAPLPDQIPAVPPSIERLIRHVVNYDEQAYDRLIHDLAYIFQTKERLGTAWILQGTSGTGKGAFLENILRPLFSHRACRVVELTSFNERFSAYDETTFIVWVDEADAKSVDRRQANKLEGTLKNRISERTIPIERKYEDARDVTNRATIFLASNEDVPAYIDSHDRRYKIAPRQETPLLKAFPEWKDRLFTDIFEPELQTFAAYLRMRPIDEHLARTPFESKARDELKQASMHAIGAAVNALRTGSPMAFLEELPMSPLGDIYLDNPTLQNLRRAVKVLFRIFDVKSSEPLKLTREDIQALFQLVDDRTPTRGRFSALLKRYNLVVRPLRFGTVTLRGMETYWHVTDEDREVWFGFLSINHGALGIIKTPDGEYSLEHNYEERDRTRSIN